MVYQQQVSRPELEELERFTGVSFSEILENLQREEPIAAWVSGSLVEGLGHKSSDIDLYVMVDEFDDQISMSRKGDGYAIKVEIRNSRRVDFEYWPRERIEQLADKLAKAPLFVETENILDYFPEYEVEFMHRLHTGIPVIGEGAWDRLRNSFDRRRLSQYLIENKQLYLDDAFDDAVGLLREGQLSSAVFRARYAVDYSVDALLFSYGSTNSKEKQRVRLFLKLLQQHPQMIPFYERFWQLITQIPQSEAGRLLYIEDALRFSEEIMNDVQRRSRDNLT